MNARRTSMLKTFFEYLGRGATPVDGYHWIDTQRTPGIAKAPKTAPVVKDDAYWAEVAANTALCQPRRRLSATGNG